MRFNRYSDLSGKHAFLSASQGSWLNYDQDKLDRVFFSKQAAQRGTDLHKFANDAIRLRQKMPETPATTMNMYVNDCIGFQMVPEQTLFYSLNCFGTADAIGFRRNVLRISDLKTGVLHASERQLEIYAALFCLEYRFDPFSLDAMELRIYQSNEVREYLADASDVKVIMEHIIFADKRINQLREETE